MRAATVDLDALIPVRGIASDDPCRDGVKSRVLLQVEKLTKADVLAAGFAQGADLLAQDTILVTQFRILFRERAARLDDGYIITQLHERRAKLYENHAQSGRKGGRLAQEYDPAHNQQSDNDPVSSVQTNFRAVAAV